MSNERDYKAYMPAVARYLLGEPNPEHSTATEWRWGTHGSKAVNLEKAAYHDHESGDQGGVLYMVKLLAKDFTATTDLGEWLAGHGLAANDNQASDNAPKKDRGRRVASYDYRDAAGAVVLRVERWEPKRFSQCRPDGNGGWLYRDIYKSFTHVPYRLPELLAADPSAPVFVVEGEKDADNLAKLGALATCNAAGATKWPDELSQHFQGRDVVILPDNDEMGGKHADVVRSKLAGVAKSIRTVELPGLPPKGDVSDWIAAGGTLHDLLALTPPIAPDNDNNASHMGMYSAADIPANWVPPYELTEDLIPAIGYGFVYGPSHAGKTFYVIDLGLRIATGRKFFGRRTMPMAVVYIAAEGSIDRRIKAWQVFNGEALDPFSDAVEEPDVSNFHIIPQSVIMVGGQADPDTLVREIKAVEARTGQKVGLVIGDTLAAMIPGADENNAGEMGGVNKFSRRIAAACQCFFLIVHHSGKNEENGMRGSGAFYNNSDVVIKLGKTTAKFEGFGIVVAEVTKNRDLGPSSDMAYILPTVEVGRSHQWPDKAITTCVVKACPPPEKPDKGDRLTPAQQKVLDYLKSLGHQGAGPGAVAAALAMDKSNAGKRLKELEARELVRSVAGIYQAISQNE